MAMNNFCYALNLPFCLNDSWLLEQKQTISGMTRIVNCVMPRDRYDAKLIDWCRSVSIEIAQIELIYTPANGWGKPHIDLHKLKDLCKINWVYGGEGSVMNWYSVKSDRSGSIVNNSVSTFITTFHTDDLNKIYGCCVRGPTLLKVGIPHNVENTSDQERWAISATFRDADSGQLLDFDTAVSKLAKYLAK
jgi:hypothetical protein